MKHWSRTKFRTYRTYIIQFCAWTQKLRTVRRKRSLISLWNTENEREQCLPIALVPTSSYVRKKTEGPGNGWGSLFRTRMCVVVLTRRFKGITAHHSSTVVIAINFFKVLLILIHLLILLPMSFSYNIEVEILLPYTTLL